MLVEDKPGGIVRLNLRKARVEATEAAEGLTGEGITPEVPVQDMGGSRGGETNQRAKEEAVDPLHQIARS